jgi:PAS domain S-box-containing protein
MTEKISTSSFNKILVVDDAAANLQFLTNLLTERGYTVYPASDGELALEFVRLVLPDLILLDIRMPVMDGYEVCRQLKSDNRTSSIPVIFISILENESDKVKAFLEGGVDYITKPFQPEEILARVRNHLRLRQLTDHLENTVCERTEELRNVNERLQNELTERLRAEEELKRERMLLTSIMETSPIGITTVDRCGKITFANSQAVTILGLTLNEITKRTYNDPEWQIADFSGNPFPEEQLPFQQVMKTLKPVFDVQHAIVWPEGRQVFLSVNGAPTFDEVGQIERIVFTLQDITERKQAERALIESEEKYRTLIQKIQTAVVVHGADTQIITCNAKAQELLGLTEKRLLGKTVIDHEWNFVREDATIMPYEEYPVKRVISTKQALRNYVVGINRRETACTTWALVNADPVFDDSGEIKQIIVSFIDITEIKQLEADRAGINRALRLLSNVNQILMHASEESALLNEVCGVIVDTGGYRLAWVGFVEYDEAKSLKPVSHAGFDSGYIIMSKITWADNENGRGPGGTAIRTGKPCLVRNILSDPTFAPWRQAAIARGYNSIAVFPLISEGVTFGALGIYSVSEDAFDDGEVEVLKELADNLAFGIAIQRTKGQKKQAEESLLKSEEKFRRLAENARDTIYRMSLPDGNYDYVSQAAYTMFGYLPEEFYSNALLFQQMIHPDWRTYFEEQKINLLKGEMPPTYEYQIIHKSGEVRWLNQRNILVTDKEGKSLAIEGIVTDITERKAAEEEIRRFSRELEDRVKERTAELEATNRELEAFSYSVSHDLRAPLRHIDGFLELLQKGSESVLDERCKHYMTIISESSRRMGILIDDLLSFSRMGRVEMSKMHLDLTTLIKDIIREFEPDMAGRNIHWHFAKLPVIRGDRVLLRTVLVNLISNALKFTRPREQTEIEIGCINAQAENIIFIRDNGVGYDPKYQEKLFNVFQRLHHTDEFEGTGIGLANVRRIINRHGGRTWAERNVDNGATFYFSIPKSN